MIRITNSMLINDFKRNLYTNMFGLEKYNQQLASGRKINSPSDNPAGLVKSLRLRTNITENNQYLRNINEAISFMETTDDALNDINSILQRIRELTVKAANGTNDKDSLDAIAKEIEELGEQIKMIANSTYSGKYIFGGTNVTEKPLQVNADGSIQWLGNDNPLKLEISVGIEFAINITNGGISSNSLQNFFAADSSAPDQDQGIFTILDKLVQDIRAGNLDEDSSPLDILDKKMTDLLTARSTIGAKVNRLELQQNRMESMKISLTGLLSNNEDADMAEVIMNLKMQENVYRASLAAGARIIQPTLIDFLR
mgnify:CR=1 FL=1